MGRASPGATVPRTMPSTSTASCPLLASTSSTSCSESASSSDRLKDACAAAAPTSRASTVGDTIGPPME